MQQTELNIYAKPLVDRLDDQWRESRRASAGWRRDGHEDRDYYFGIQWKADEEALLAQAGRPAIVINQIFKSLNNLIGRERGNRLDWKAQPRGASDVQDADLITQGLAYVGDQTRSKYATSSAARDAFLGPLGWLEVGLDDTDPTKEPLFVSEESWENMWFDPFGRKRDLSDFRYIIRSKLFDLDLVVATYSEHAEALKAAVALDKERHDRGVYTDGDDYGIGRDRPLDITDLGAGSAWCDHERQRVRLREHWWWENEKGTFWAFPDGRVMDADLEDPATLAHLAAGAQLREGIRKVYKFAVVAGRTILAQGKSPYPFSRFPFVAVWAYVDDRGRPFGVVRNQKDPQKELNVNRSRVNQSQRSRWAVVNAGAMDATEVERLRNDISQSNFVAAVRDPSAIIQLGSDKADVGGWLNLMETSRREVDDVAGQNETAYGDKDSTAKSGIAKQVQVQQQSLNMMELFDNIRYAHLQVGEMLLALMQKHYSAEKLRRIAEVSTLKENPNADISWLGQALANPIEQMRFDIVIDDQAETTTERQAAMDQAIQLMQFAGPAAPVLIPDIIRMSNFAGKDEMAAKIEAALAPPPPPMPAALPPGAPPGLPPDIPLPPPPPVPPAGGFPLGA